MIVKNNSRNPASKNVVVTDVPILCLLNEFGTLV